MIDELRRLLGEATPGPWTHLGGRNWQPYPERRTDRDVYQPGDARSTEDAALIVALRNHAPSLLARLEAAEAVVGKAREVKQTDEAWHSLQEDHASALAADPERGESGFEDDLGEMGAALDRSYLALFKALAHYDAVREETR